MRRSCELSSPFGDPAARLAHGYGIMTGVVSLGEPLTVEVAVSKTGVLAGSLINVSGVVFELRQYLRTALIEPKEEQRIDGAKPVVISYYEASIFKEEDLRERARALRIAEGRGLL